jgi:hypothetical protein
MKYFLYLLFFIVILKIFKINKEPFYFKQDINTENRYKINDNHYYSKGPGLFLNVINMTDRDENDKYNTKKLINLEKDININKILNLNKKFMNYNIKLLEEVN